MTDEADASLLKTPLHAAHVALGARMVPFAGYDMPVQYPAGIVAEHRATRDSAGLFDVSHMGQLTLVAPDHRHESVAGFLETLVPGDLRGLAPGRQRYTQFLNEDGGVLDDLMVARPADPTLAGTLLLVVNAARKHADEALLRGHLPPGFTLTRHDDRALIALQGPASEAVLTLQVPDAAAMRFMEARASAFDGEPITLSRSGYTGEDGYELFVPAALAARVWEALLADPRVSPVGLGARDSLRLEAGLCLYGHDMDETVSPVEAGLAWSIGARRREQGGFPGAARVQRELRLGAPRRRVGLRPEGRAPVREGAAVATPDGLAVGRVTSGGFGPTVDAPVAMALVHARFAEPGTPLLVELRGKPVPAAVAPLPFVPPRFKR